MKSTLIVILFIALAVLLSQFKLSLKDNSLIVRYAQPLFYDTLESAFDIVSSGEEAPSNGSPVSAEENRDFETAELRQVID